MLLKDGLRDVGQLHDISVARVLERNHPLDIPFPPTKPPHGKKGSRLGLGLGLELELEIGLGLG